MKHPHSVGIKRSFFLHDVIGEQEDPSGVRIIFCMGWAYRQVLSEYRFNLSANGILNVSIS